MTAFVLELPYSGDDVGTDRGHFNVETGFFRAGRDIAINCSSVIVTMLAARHTVGAFVAAAVMAAAVTSHPVTAVAQAVGPAAETPAPKATKQAAKSTKAPADDATSTDAQAKRRDPATLLAALENGSKLLAAGKVDQAVAVLSDVISIGNLPTTLMARALYLRGSAYRKQSKPALAISDLTSALWLKGGLVDPDRTDATQQRAAAYSEAGLTDQGQVLAESAQKRHAETASTQAPAKSSGFFGGLFGGTAQPLAAEKVPEKMAASKSEPLKATAAASPLSSPPASPPSRSATVATATVAAKPVASAATKAAEGNFKSRVALVRTRAEAEAVVAKLRSQFAPVLANHAPEIGEAAFGNMGSFYQVRVGPFASAAEAQAMCGQLKGSGLDCVPVDR